MSYSLASCCLEDHQCIPVLDFYFLMFGRYCRLPVDLVFSLLKLTQLPRDAYVADLRQLEMAWNLHCEHLQVVRDSHQELYNQRCS